MPWPWAQTEGALAPLSIWSHQLADIFPLPPCPDDVPAGVLGLTQWRPDCTFRSGLPGDGHLMLGWAGWFRACWVLRAPGCVCVCVCGGAGACMCARLGLLVSVCRGVGGLM